MEEMTQEDTIRKTEGKPEEKGTKIIREEEMKEKDKKREDIKGTKKEKIRKEDMKTQKTNQSLTETTKEETKIIDQEITTKLKEANIHLIRSQKNIWKIRTAV